MAGIDKLHKIYSSTFEPLVWARSVGLEILNELDTVKAAIMMVAGGEPGRSNAPDQERKAAGIYESGWATIAAGARGLATGMDSAHILRERVTGMVKAGVRDLLK
jgi:ubiquinone biosynthesis monooxygenase Coq6